MAHSLSTILVAGITALQLHANEPRPCPKDIRSWLTYIPGTNKLISNIAGSKKTFTVDQESPNANLYVKEIHENAQYICLSFIWDTHSDIIFVLDKSQNVQVDLGKRFNYYSLHGLIDPNFLLIAQEEFSGSSEEDYHGFVVLRLSDKKHLRFGKDGWDYFVRVKGDCIAGTRLVTDHPFDPVPYSIPIKRVLQNFK